MPQVLLALFAGNATDTFVSGAVILLPTVIAVTDAMSPALCPRITRVGYAGASATPDIDAAARDATSVSFSCFMQQPMSFIFSVGCCSPDMARDAQSVTRC